LDLSNTLDLGGDLGHVSLDRNGWNFRDWKEWEVADGLKSTLTASYDPDSEVETLNIEVMVEATQQVLLSQKMHDAFDLSSAVLRAMALSKNGKQLAVISADFNNIETASIVSGSSTQGIPLRDFRGDEVDRTMSHTIDSRGAAFSSSGNILAICEDENVVGFWRSNGELIGRVVFQTAARGSVVHGATGLSPEFLMANSDGKDGWIVEAPS
jgi:WD40 repeat protein